MSQEPRFKPCCGGSRYDEMICGDMSRRQFLKTTGAGLVTLSSLGSRVPVMAGPFTRSGAGEDHFVPADKRLNREWLRSLYVRGAARVCRDRELKLIGMPVGGVGAGQVYLCGDGALGEWKIFNQQYFSGYGRDNYQPHMPDKPIAQGFAIVVEDQGRMHTRRLDRQGFPEVEFVGEYPLGRLTYAAADCPVRVTLEAFSPFIPLNARDSAIPGTVLEYTIENTSGRPLRVGVLGWLENAICLHNVREHELLIHRRSRMVAERGRTLLVHTAQAPPPDPTPPRQDVVLADFEGGTYGGWTAEGAAFGDQPAQGTLPSQNPVTGFVGQGLVNTFRGGDDPHGRLASPTFDVSRKYICFLIGGGKHPAETCINLLIDGKVVRTATGENRERLLWHSWDVQEFTGKPAQIEIVDKRSGHWGHVNIDRILLSDQRRFGTAAPLEELEDFGSMVLALDAPGANPEDTKALLSKLGGFAEELQAAADVVYPSSEKRVPALATQMITLRPGEKQEIAFVLAWYFPNRAEGNMYTNWFDSAADVAHYALDNRQRLAGHTRLWHDRFYDSTLPRWLLDRLHSTVCNLATGTCLWWKNGRFWAWEGVGCCSGTCTHVWNYAQALARLLPQLERSAREMQDLGAALHDSGLVGFRGEQNNAYAADGQCGTVLKCYREHQMSADDGFLRRNWPKIKRVLEYSIQQDADSDGLIESSQHNTYDINFHGANTFVGALYLAALRAGEEMAREVGDVEFAQRARTIFETGSRQTVERLWNGEYFVQDVNLEQHPKYQYGDGCLSDQLFGQGWAHQLGLGYLYPENHVRKALESVWKYNWTPDIAPHNLAHKPERWFVSPGEAGLFTCTWPKSKHLDRGVRYRNEVWTGIEYQVAGHMIWEGMVEEGLVIVRAIHDRYDPLKHNPFNEVECGDHYARALASWGVYLALCGYEYHGPKGYLGFAPRLSPEDFRATFTAAEGWGTFAQQRQGVSQHERIELHWGRLRLASLAFAVPESIDRTRVRVQLGGRAVTVDAQPAGERLLLRFADEVTLNAGDALDVVIGS